MGVIKGSRRGRCRTMAPGVLVMAVAMTMNAAVPSSFAQSPMTETRLAQLGAQRNFEIPAQPLSSALVLFGQQSGLQVTVDGSVVRSLSAQAVSGTMTAQQALQRLLAGTGLTYAVSGGTTIAIQSAPRESEGRIELGPITVEGNKESGYGPVSGYKASRSATATKTDTPIIDIPSAVQVVPREVIRDQNATRLLDAVRNVSGVQGGGTSGNRSDGFLLRGFSTTRVAKDGFLSASSFGDVGFIDLVNIERVEVLKGPASVLYGQNNPGGLINLVSRKPQPKAFYGFDGTYGSNDFYRGEIDLNQPLTTDGKLLFRLNAAYQNTDSFRDFFVNAKRAVIAPSLRLALPDTTVDLQLEYYYQRQQFDRGLVAIGKRADLLPRDRYLGERFSRGPSSELRVNAVVDHRFNEAWSWRSSFRAAWGDQDRLSADPQGLRADNRTLNRRAADLRTDIGNYAAQTEVTGKFDTGFLNHQLLVGFDANFTRFRSSLRTASLAPIDIFNPVYGARPGAFGPATTQNRQIDLYGFYLQDLVSIGTQWKLLLGGRFDYAKSKFKRDGQIITDATDKVFSPRVGLVFQPVENLSLYASYTESFLPFVTAVSANGTPFKPEEGRQIEVGIKRDWLDGRLSTTLAVFQLTRRNVLTADPANPGFSIQTGEQRSRGVEVDISGEVMPNWKVFGSITYLDAKITADRTFAVGNQLASVPRWSGSIWTTYAIKGGTFDGLELGGGVFAVGRRKGDLNNSFSVAGYASVDLLVRYRINQNLEASFNVSNLFNANFVEAAVSRTEIYPGTPRSFFGRLSLKL
ncbi:TonB-dependent siderophore receptor [Reyranella sp. CPCC 100927]|nr:TonB-dependent siderophore receptor [Reyranella sp. CPCC 100927]